MIAVKTAFDLLKDITLYNRDIQRIIAHIKNTPYEKQYKYMHQNQQTLITAFDIYNTFGNIIYGDNYKSIKKNSKKRHTCRSGNGGSLFDDLKPKTRKPSIYSSIARIINKSCK